MPLGDAAAWAASTHESRHAAACALLKIPLLGIRRSTRYEACTILDTDGVDGLDRDALLDEAVRRAAAIIVPFVMGSPGTAGDVVMFGKLGEAGVPLQRSYKIALDLAASTEHFELCMCVVDRLMACPSVMFDEPVVGADALRRALQ